MRNSLHRTLAAATLLLCLPLVAQEKGYWRAASSNAKSITGDVTLYEQKLMINFINFPMVRVRALEKPELSAAFDADPRANGTGSLYRLSIPAQRKFLGRNTICGSDDTTWMAAYVSGHSLQLAFFSGEKPPVFTLEALANSTDLCGTYSYIG